MKDPELLKEAVEALGGEFELIRQLGQGATSVVYLLRDHALDRDVAMKVIRATFAGTMKPLHGSSGKPVWWRNSPTRTS